MTFDAANIVKALTAEQTAELLIECCAYLTEAQVQDALEKGLEQSDREALAESWFNVNARQ